MASNEITKNFPKCELMRVLAKKVSQREDIGFSSLSFLEKFRKDVTDEMSQINVLFPEYTPHNEGYHLKNLFYIADTVLGTNLIEAMNAGELFVLAVALYGHDWGMAVNEKEKNYIICTINSSDKVPDGLCLLHDEKNRFSKFVQDQQLLDDSGELKDIPIEKWREYVRDTHAFRSGERIRKFFEPIDGGVAEAAARVCTGHWLSFEELQDHDYYPLNYSVMRDQVNLRAITVYLRLIDLLDLAEDRTPYVIWKFVAPKDSKSKMEWDKHRALRSVICTSYQVGRVIRVDGSTDSHEVYAALEDLRLWCEAQFRGCNDILARMNDLRHKLDIYNIDWNVEAKGFKNTSIGFQFDRERMFEILGNEIYQGDPYVFLRELLQNSIDAIRMRREVLRKNAKIEPANFGEIQVKVEHLDNNDAIITWHDDGIGMDEYIIQNYLSIAGKSYYRSQDFEKVGLEMDPISRFGIGILSCFIVADSIEIETYMDPNLHKNSEALKISIPDQSKRFRVEVLPEGTAEIGTTIRVFIKGRKIFTDNDGDEKSFDVTKYLEIIAGFVEFPIIVDEDGKKTIILHPNGNIKMIKQRFGEEFKLHKLELKYPWSDAILPQDLPIAQELLKEGCFDLASDLGMENYEGTIACVIPSDEVIDFKRVAEEIEIVCKDRESKKIRMERNWAYGFPTITEFGKSTHGDRFSQVYKDGIYVPNATRRTNFDFFNDYEMPPSQIKVNILTKKNNIVNLSRTDFCGQHNHWYDPIREEYIKKICNLNLEKLLALNPLDRLFQMGRIVASYNVPVTEFWNEFPHDHWPVAFMQSNGKIDVREYNNICKMKLFRYPIPLESGELYNIFGSDNYSGFLINWIGNDIIIDGENKPYGFLSCFREAVEISGAPVKQFYHEAYAQFINSPWDDNPPLIQDVLIQAEMSREPANMEDLIERGFDSPKSLDPYELSLLNSQINRISHYELPIKFVNFSKPFDDLFSYGSKIINIRNPSGQDLLRFICLFYYEKKVTDLPRDTLGRLRDLISEFVHTGYSHHYSKIVETSFLIENETNLSFILNEIWRIAKEAKVTRLIDLEEAIPCKEDFIPGTIIHSENERKKFHDGYIKKFGEPI